MSTDLSVGTARAFTVGDLSPTPRAAVIVSATPDGSVLYSTETEHYFGLNRTGTFIWNNLHPKCETVDEICAAVHAEFPSGEPNQIARDVERLLARLLEKQLVDPRIPT
jgi:hypothetical protein